MRGGRVLCVDAVMEPVGDAIPMLHGVFEHEVVVHVAGEEHEQADEHHGGDAAAGCRQEQHEREIEHHGQHGEERDEEVHEAFVLQFPGLGQMPAQQRLGIRVVLVLLHVGLVLPRPLLDIDAITVLVADIQLHVRAFPLFPYALRVAVRRSHQAVLECENRSLDAVVRMGFLQDVRHVRFHRGQSDIQLLCNLLV